MLAVQIAPVVTPEVIAGIILAVTSLLGAPIIQVVKEITGLEDRPAVILAVAVSFVLAGITAALNGAFNGFDFSMEAIASAASVIFSIATLFYKLLIKGRAAGDPAGPGE